MCCKDKQVQGGKIRTLVKTKRIKRNGVVVKTIRTYKVEDAPPPKMCRKVLVKRVKTFTTDYWGRRKLVNTRVVSKKPVTGYYPCGSR